MPDRTERTIEAHLRAAVESAPSGLLMTDAEGRIVLVNREIERMFGYAREELLGQPIERLVPMRYHGAHPGYRSGFRADPRVRAMGAGRDLFGQRKDGSEVPVEIGLTPLATEDGLFVLGAVVDISERKRLEAEQAELNERLRQSQKMEAIGTLAGGIAHDFNNLLGGIIGFTELILGNAAPGSPVANDAHQVLEAAMRGRQLVERILAFSRREEAERRPVDLRDVVREVQHLLRATLPATVALTVKAPEQVPRVLADATSVHQVLMNLAANATHAMPGGGSLEISIEPIYVRDSVAKANPELREGPHLAIDVRDNGAGMDEATRARAFEPFFTTRPAGSGTGLGLSMVHGIMRDHAGTATIESVRGGGTVVRCYFPALADVPAEQAVAAALDSMQRGASERILYVDDEPALLEASRRRLERVGYVVDVAPRASFALERLRSDPQRIDLLVTDLSMPEMNGIELAKQVHALRPDLPIVLLSGYVDDLSQPDLARVGIRRVLRKPVTIDELATACRESLDASRKAGGR